MAKFEVFIKKGLKQTLKKGEVLIRGGEEPKGIYLLESGIIKMSTFLKDGTEITFNFFKPGSFFPMIWAIAQAPNIYNFQAVTESTVYRVSENEVFDFLEKNNQVYKDLVKRILSGFDSLLGSFPYLLSGSSSKRVAAAILFLARRFGEKSKEGLMLKIKIRHEDLAGMAALSRETVSLAVEKLQKKEADMEDFSLPPPYGKIPLYCGIV